MTLAEWAWIALAAYAIHMLEEFMLNWRDWARAVIGLPVSWADFYVTNGIVVVLGIAQANLAPSLPFFPLAFASLMLVNAVFFHVLPVIRMRGRYSPGVTTAILLFLPVGISVFCSAHTAGGLSWATGLGASAAGVLLMATPIVFLKIRDKPYFRQAEGPPADG
ncbi:HXXEE domain-containing protein [Aestuariivirga sp.]|uniref:HXXEE domain-containing protein n=1 Tax=Aestuariivirga sp. TaxID=2650926 RepID=UPI0039E60FBD